MQSVLVQGAVITAVLYYLGWIRAAETFRYFGVDVSIVGLSTADYILRSPPTAVPVIIVLNATAFGAVELYERVGFHRLRARPRHYLRLTFWLVSGIAVAALAVLYARYADWGSRLGFGLPLLLTLAAGSAAAARWVAAGSAAAARRVSPQPRGASDPLGSAALALLAGTGLIWAFTLYGTEAGRQAARTFHAELPSRPAITVYSAKLLVLPGATYTAAYPSGATTEAAYRYRYQGLRLLARTQDGYLLLPERWQRGDPVYLVALGDGVRIDLEGSR